MDNGKSSNRAVRCTRTISKNVRGEREGGGRKESDVDTIYMRRWLTRVLDKHYKLFLIHVWVT